MYVYYLFFAEAIPGWVCAVLLWPRKLMDWTFPSSRDALNYAKSYLKRLR